MTSIEVYHPWEKRSGEPIPHNRRPETLDDRTIAFVWDYLFKGPEFFDGRFQQVRATSR